MQTSYLSVINLRNGEWGSTLQGRYRQQKNILMNVKESKNSSSPRKPFHSEFFGNSVIFNDDHVPVSILDFFYLFSSIIGYPIRYLSIY